MSAADSVNHVGEDVVVRDRGQACTKVVAPFRCQLDGEAQWSVDRYLPIAERLAFGKIFDCSVSSKRRECLRDAVDVVVRRARSSSARGSGAGA